YGRFDRELQKLAGPLVCEEDALLGVDGDDSLCHTAEYRAELLAVLLDLAKLLRQPLAHGVERAGQDAELVGADGIDFMAVVARGDLLGPGREFAQRAGDAPGEHECQAKDGDGSNGRD